MSVLTSCHIFASQHYFANTFHLRQQSCESPFFHNFAKMPKISNKRALVNEICQIASFDISQSSEEKVDGIIDDALEDLANVMTLRTVVPRSFLAKSDVWFTTILPELDDFRYKQHLRVSRVDFGRIYDRIKGDPVFNGRCSSRQVPVEKQLAITLFKLGCDGAGSSLAKCSASFAIGDGGTIMIIMRRVFTAILRLEKDWIQWPDSEERRQIEAEMGDKLPKCIGYIDGSHVTLAEAPLDDPESYFTRKQKYAVHLQAVCDNNCKIRHITVGYPGSVHDARVFRNSELGRSPSTFLSNGQYLEGDSAYAVTPYMMTPFRDNATVGTADQRKIFNKHFSQYRVKIECTFGILKQTFGSLRGLRLRVCKEDGHRMACDWITCCVILYNMIRESISEDEMAESAPESDAGTPRTIEVPIGSKDGEAKRRALFDFVIRSLS